MRKATSTFLVPSLIVGSLEICYRESWKAVLFIILLLTLVGVVTDWVWFCHRNKVTSNKGI